MIDHGAVLLACRAHAATLSVATTGSTTLAATATGYTRATGSFLTDGFRAGMEVTPASFTDTTPRTLTAVTALALTVNGTPTVQSAATGRTLSVGLPSAVAYTNVAFNTPDARTPWVEEAYLPGAADRITMGTLGNLEMSGLYQLTFYAPTGLDASALYGYADALVTHFAPDTPLTLSTGDVTRVRGRPAPYPSSVVQVDGGWAACTVTIPLLTRTANSR